MVLFIFIFGIQIVKPVCAVGNDINLISSDKLNFIFLYYKQKRYYGRICLRKIEIRKLKQKIINMRESFLNSVVYIALCIVLPMNVWLVVLYKYIGWIVLVSEILLFAFIMHIIKFKLVYQISRLHNLNNEDPESTVKRSEIFNLKKVDLIAKKLKTCKPNMLENIKTIRYNY